MKKKTQDIILMEASEEPLGKKYAIAKELGLLERVKTDGWKSLTAKETGRIGGMMATHAHKGGETG